MPVKTIRAKIDVSGLFRKYQRKIRSIKIKPIVLKAFFVMNFRRLATVAALLGALSQSAQAFDVKVEGISGEVRSNVDALLQPVKENSFTEVRQTYRAQVDRAIKRALQALGFYQSVIHYSWQESKGKKPAILVAKIHLGKPARVAATSLTIRGEAKHDEVFEALKENLPKKDRQLNHGEYESFKSSIERAVIRHGYFDGEFVTSELGVDAVENKAYWTFDYDAKTRYRFGDIHFIGSQIREPIMVNLLPFKKGDPYTSDDISELNRRLSATGWFNSVVVSPDIFSGRGSPDKSLPVYANVTPKKENAVETGLGFSTDVGPRGSVTWRKPWLNDSGHSLEASTELSSKEQLADVSYKIPLEKSALEHYWVIQGGIKKEDLNDTKSDSASAMISRHWAPYEGWQRDVHLRWSINDFDQGEISDKTMLIYPGVTFSKTTTLGGLMPTWGLSQRYTIDWSNTTWGSDIDFVVLEAQHALIKTFADRHRFVLRSHLGWIQTDDFEQVPPDLRFFAGGDRSVRGYKYESISPEDENGDLTGAEKLVTGSFEYQYRVTGNWWGAVFFDIGQAVNNFNNQDWKKGVGVGVRWQSPLGPIKLDIATPVGDPDKHDVQFYIGLGPEL